MILRLRLSAFVFSLLTIVCIGLAPSSLVPFGGAPEAEASSFYFDPAYSEFDVCMDPVYCIEVWVDSFPEIQGFSVEITYSSDLHLVAVLEGSIFGGPSYLDSLVREGGDEDTLAVDGACLGVCATPGPGHLFSICFGEPWTCGITSDLVFLWCLVADGNNDETYLPGINGSITVSCATSSGVTTWSSIKTLYR